MSTTPTVRQIVCRAHEVRAILAGTQTQMRRIVKLPHQNPLGQWEQTTWGGKGARDKFGQEHPEQAALWHTRTGDCLAHGAIPGDRLWVRETWAYGVHAMASARDEDGPFVYAATDSTQHRLCEKWTPSIHMPRWASRITLEITAVRVEKLQDITEADAMAEGIVSAGDGNGYQLADTTHYMATARDSYASLWDHINGDNAWDKNPWVWVVEFKRVTP